MLNNLKLILVNMDSFYNFNAHLVWEMENAGSDFLLSPNLF